MKKGKAKTLEPSLRLDSNSILKELGRLGPCDASNSCHYSRDWTLLVHKKHFSGKQQQPMSVNTDQLIIKAGEYRLGIEHPDFPIQCQRSSLENLFSKLDILKLTDSNATSPMKAMITACKEWTRMPPESRLLPSYFYPLQFDTSATSCAENNALDNTWDYTWDSDKDEEDYFSLLRQLGFDRQGLLLTVDQIELLSGIDNKVDTNHDGACLSPSDLEVERAIVNESMAKCIKDECVDLEGTLVESWSIMNGWMVAVEELDKEFDSMIGTGLDKTMSAFVNQYDIVFPFQDFWAPLVPGFKKKTAKKTGGPTEMLAIVDETFINYMDQLSKVTEDFYLTFVSSTMVSQLECFNTHIAGGIQKVSESLANRQQVLKRLRYTSDEQITSILEMKASISSLSDTQKQQLADGLGTRDRIDDLENHIDDIMNQMQALQEKISPADFDKLALKLIDGHDKLIEQCIKNIQQYANEKWIEQKTEIEQLKLVYLNESLPNVAGRIEKVAHKDFRKKLKKIEHRYSTMRQGFAYQLKNALFPSSSQVIRGFYETMTDMQLLTMSEGSLMEMIMIVFCNNRFRSNHKKLINRRSKLANDFKYGIAMGKKKLAVVIKSMVLAEGKRLELENEAIHRAKSIGGHLPSNKDSAATTSLYAAIAMIASTSVDPSKKKRKGKSSTPDNVSQVSTKSEAPQPSSDKASESITAKSPTSSPMNNGYSKARNKEKVPSSNEVNQPPSSTSKSISPTATMPSSLSTNKHVTANPTSSNIPSLPAATTPPSLSTNKSSSDIASSVPATINKHKVENAHSPSIKKQSTSARNKATSSVTAKNDKDQPNVKAGMTSTTSTTTMPSNANLNQRGNATEKAHTFSRKRHRLPNSDTQHKATSPISARDELGQRTEINEPAEQQIDSWTSPAPSSSSSSSMTWSQTVASKLPTQSSSWTSSTTTTTTRPSLSSSPMLDNAWNKSVDMETVQVQPWNAPPSTLSWSQTVASSNVPPLIKSAAETASDSSQEASQSNPQQQLSNSVWNEPIASHTPQQEVKQLTTTVNTVPLPIHGKKGRWSSEWEAEAKSFSDRPQPTEMSLNTDSKFSDSKEEGYEPALVNISLKDILATSQENHNVGTNYENNPRRPGMMPPPALGGMNTSTTPMIMADTNQLYQLNQDSLINMVQSLRIENQQLQQSMLSMQQALTMTMNLAKEREEQTLLLFNTRKQSEIEEARIYILSLEEQIKDLQSQASRAPPPSTSAFINQDLFANYRQEIHTDGSDSNQNYRNNGGQYPRRPGKKPYWQNNKTVVKCSNCGEANHTSSECKDSCRYCGSLNHLSENCDKS